MPKESSTTPLLLVLALAALVSITDHLADQAEAKQAERTHKAVYEITNRGIKHKN